MVKVENARWNALERPPLVLPFVGQLVLHSFDEFSEFEQKRAAESLTRDAHSPIHSALVDTDPDGLPYVTFNLRMEAESESSAMRLLAVSAIEAWIDAGKDPDDLTYVAAQLAWEPEAAVTGEDLHTAVIDTDYNAERLDLYRVDELDELVLVEPGEIFGRALNEYL